MDKLFTEIGQMNALGALSPLGATTKHYAPDDESGHSTIRHELSADQLMLDMAKRGYDLHAEGRAEGRVEGWADGRLDGLAAGYATAVVTVLRTRHIQLSDAAHVRISAEKDLERLQRWLKDASIASSIATVLDEEL